MRTVFADAFYFIALLNERDHAHRRAIKIAPAPLLTTDWVLTETADACSTMPSRSKVAEFIRQMAKDPDVRVIRFSQALFERGLQLYQSRADKHWSLTDCISFVVMEDEGISDALTGDKHFQQAGFNALLK